MDLVASGRSSSCDATCVDAWARAIFKQNSQIPDSINLFASYASCQGWSHVAKMTTTQGKNECTVCMAKRMKTHKYTLFRLSFHWWQVASALIANQSKLRSKHHQIAEDNHQIQASWPERPYAQEACCHKGMAATSRKANRPLICLNAICLKVHLHRTSYSCPRQTMQQLPECPGLENPPSKRAACLWQSDYSLNMICERVRLSLPGLKHPCEFDAPGPWT